MKRRMLELTAQHTGQTLETIEKDSQRDHWFSAQEAKDYGLIDAIFTSSAHAAAAEA
jgi:ATP-dependent Clp protease protease subunit